MSAEAAAGPRAAERLFARTPGLRARVAWVPLTRPEPTPIHVVADRFVVKDDGRTAPTGTYGGNKVRKLEFLLAEAARRGGPFVTTGATGSHHALASAVHAARLGLDVEVVRFPQPRTPHVDAMAARLDACPNVTVHPVAADWLHPAGLALRRVAHAPHRPLVTGPGGSTPLGTLGYVAAGLEIADDLARSSLPEPDAVVTPASSAGTAAGLAVGLALAGWRRCRVHAVRVASPALTNRPRIARLVGRTLRLLGRHAPGAALDVEIDHRWIGGGYGVPTGPGASATRHAADLGFVLDPTYTAKAWAAARFLHAAGERVLHLHTLAPD